MSYGLFVPWGRICVVLIGAGVLSVSSLCPFACIFLDLSSLLLGAVYLGRGGEVRIGNGRQAIVFERDEIVANRG